MLGGTRTEQYEFFVGSLRDLIPDEHVLARVDRVLDLSWLRAEVADLYCPDNGRPGIAPEAAVRLMLAGFLLGVVHDRRLMREAAVNVAIRWFCGFGLTERLPDHSSLTRIRQRWGAERFRCIFERSVRACVEPKIATGEVVHIDASLIRADVSWDALARRWAETVQAENEPLDDGEPSTSETGKTGKFKKVCLSDPEASMATSSRTRRLEPTYKQHTAVCDKVGVIVDVEVTTGERNEGGQLEPALARIEAVTGTHVATATADTGYSYAKIYGALERRGTEAVIPARAESIRTPVPLRRFRYDAKHDRLECPRGRVLNPGRLTKKGRIFTSRVQDCRRCNLARLCLSPGRVNKAVTIVADYAALLRARRRHERGSDEDKALYDRHRWRVEGVHGEAKTSHGLARAMRRGLANMKIQAYLTATAINLKRLPAAIAALLWLLVAVLLDLAARAPRTTRGRPASALARRGFFNSPTAPFPQELMW